MCHLYHGLGIKVLPRGERISERPGVPPDTTHGNRCVPDEINR